MGLNCQQNRPVAGISAVGLEWRETRRFGNTHALTGRRWRGRFFPRVRCVKAWRRRLWGPHPLAFGRYSGPTPPGRTRPLLPDSLLTYRLLLRTRAGTLTSRREPSCRRATSSPRSLSRYASTIWWRASRKRGPSRGPACRQIPPRFARRESGFRGRKYIRPEARRARGFHECLV